MTGISESIRARRSLFRTGSSVWRVRQFVASVLNVSDPGIDDELRRLVSNEEQWALLARLSPFDRSHQLRVRRHLVERGCDDPDLLLAALLHDAGKADDCGMAGSPARALSVLARRVPGLNCRLTTERHPRWLHGLYLAEHHAQLGASLARAAGASERCCELISRHEEDTVVDDPLLAALVAADNAVIR
ncbi:MAG TPA: hypothetical protein VMM78_18975 [Thermomicrobiales bacterium]|nr:hypothetical protein [Thermomicrobiales bacterium]